MIQIISSDILIFIIYISQTNGKYIKKLEYSFNFLHKLKYLKFSLYYKTKNRIVFSIVIKIHLFYKRICTRNQQH
jgi:hypothetical protein